MERPVGAILREMEEAGNGHGVRLSERLSDVRTKLLKIGSMGKVDSLKLKEEIKRMLVFLLAEAPTPYEMRETIKMLAQVEGYTKVGLSVEVPGRMDDPAEASRLKRLAEG